MLAFGIRYLNGFAAAAEPDDRERAEWPPHPGRIFMALAAAHFQTDADPQERAALLWLEGPKEGGEISMPYIVAPEALQRAIVQQYVPVNDKAGPSKALLQSAPLTRERQSRVFARASLEDDTVYLSWPDLDPPESHVQALAGLCAKVTRIGHSSSLVQMWLADGAEVGEPNWQPDEERATIRLRIAGPGTIEHLERLYNAEAVEDYATLKVDAETASDQKTRKAARQRLKQQYGNHPPPQLRPRLSFYQGYAPPVAPSASPAACGTLFSPHLLALKLEPEDSVFRELDLASTLAVVARWREAILSHGDGESDVLRSLLSGHDNDGTPLKTPHLAFVPLAFVGHDHADGHLLGMGLALPAAVDRNTRRAALRVIGQVRQLKLGRLGVWRVIPVTESRPAVSLRPETWTAYPQGATQWSTVTPVVFDRHPKAKHKANHQRELADMIAKGCERAGLPTPREEIITPVSAHLGVPPAHAFPKLQRKDGSPRRHAHAILVFDEPVCGPVLIGAGRFRGYGVCRPLDWAGETERGQKTAVEAGMDLPPESA